jgi:hypothetical protein
MSDGADAILQDHEGRAVLRFERPLSYPLERVWRALTEREELNRAYEQRFAIKAEEATPPPAR